MATFATVALVGAVFCDARVARTGYLPHASPFDVMLGQAATPFQYRLLVPKLVYFVATLFPALVPETRLCLGVAEWLFFVAAFACIHRLTGVLAPDNATAPSRVVVALLAVPFAYLVLPPFRPFYNACDTASVFFLIACTLALVEERRGLFAVLFLVGTLNRETTLIVLIAWALTAYRGGSLRRDRVALMACAGGFFALKAALVFVYASNPGDGLFQTRHDIGDHALHLFTNLGVLVSYPRGVWFGGLVLAPLSLAAAFRRHAAHPLLVACIDIAPVVVTLLLVVGNADELRMFADVMMLVLLALATAKTTARGGAVVPAISGVAAEDAGTAVPGATAAASEDAEAAVPAATGGRANGGGRGVRGRGGGGTGSNRGPSQLRAWRQRTAEAAVPAATRGPSQLRAWRQRTASP